MREGCFFEDLSVGQKASFGKTITEADIVLFAAVTGDTNPMHLNEEYARDSFFSERIAHGMLAAGLITKVMGTQLPGPGHDLHVAVAALPRAGEDRRHGDRDGRDHRR